MVRGAVSSAGTRRADRCPASIVGSSWGALRVEWPLRPFRGAGLGLRVSRHLRFARCRSARSVRKAGCCGSSGCNATGSPATSTSSGPTWPGASGSAAPPRAGSARLTGSTARSRSPSSSTTRRSRSGWLVASATSLRTSGPTAGTPPYPEDAGAKPYDLWAILLVNKALVQYHEATGDARVLEAVRRSLKALLAGLVAHSALRLGPLPLVRGAGPGPLRLRADGRRVAPRPGAHAARAGGRLRGPLSHRRRDAADASPWALEVDEARRQHGHGHQGVRPFVATRPPPGRPRLRAPNDRDPRPLPRPGDRHVHAATSASRAGTRSRAPSCAPWSSTCTRWRSCSRSSAIRRSATGWSASPTTPCPATFTPDMWAHQYDQQVNQVQCTVNPEHLWTHQRPRVEHLRPRAELRLLHREHAPGLAEVRRAPVDGDAGRRPGGRGLRAEPR